MMFHERYADLSAVKDLAVDRATAITDFWEVYQDMHNIVQALPKGEERARLEGSLWAIRWIADLGQHPSFNCLNKLWDDLEGKTRLPKRFPFNREEQLRSSREWVARDEDRMIEAARELEATRILGPC